MPHAARHPCSQPGCPELVPRGAAKCPAHRSLAGAWRSLRRQWLSSARWQLYRDAFFHRAENALCNMTLPGGQPFGCKKDGRVTAADVVDHRTPDRGNAALFWDAANHQPACAACHNLKTALGL